jgi:hypothetical protein
LANGSGRREWDDVDVEVVKLVVVSLVNIDVFFLGPSFVVVSPLPPLEVVVIVGVVKSNSGNSKRDVDVG